MAGKWSVKRVLVLAPHTDDGEIGAGGLLSKLNEAGVHKKYVAFSTCPESVPATFPRDVLTKEVREATRCLGFNESDLTILDFPVRRFPQFRQEILEKLIEIKKEFAPDLVLAPTSYDIHQDHGVVHQEAVRAFKTCTLLGYELPWNCIDFRSDLLFELEERHVAEKIHAIQCYQSQSFRVYGDGAPLRRLAEVRGDQIGVRFAEAFQVIRWIWRSL
jgi:LmbE family N-acetylglucosaminyl deacetylase